MMGCGTYVGGGLLMCIPGAGRMAEIEYRDDSLKVGRFKIPMRPSERTPLKPSCPVDEIALFHFVYS